MATTTSGRDIVRQYLAGYGLEALTDWAYDLYTGKHDGVPHTLDDIKMLLPQQEVFKQVFPRYEEIVKANPGFTINSYVQYKMDMTAALTRYRIPSGMYDTAEGIANLLVKGVSSAEAQQRLAIAADAATNAPVEVRNALASMYGVTLGDLTAYYLDPEKAMPLLQHQYSSAQVAGAADQQGVAADQALAERLASQGVGYADAVSGFGKVAANKELTQATFTQQSVDTNTLIDAVFGNAGAQTQAQKVAAQRGAEYQANPSSAVASQRGVSGLSNANR